MKILMLTTWFPVDPARRTLPNELADAFVRAGHEIDITVIEWNSNDIKSAQQKDISDPAEYEVKRYLPLDVKVFGKSISLMLRWFCSSIQTTWHSISKARSNDYDVIICYMPLSLMWATVISSFMNSKAKRYLILWDFYPFHHYMIGLLPSMVLTKILAKFENLLLRRIDVIGCMSQANITFLKNNYRLKKTQKVEVLPIWGEPGLIKKADRRKTRLMYELPLDRPIAVFGGTLSKGRGLGDILAAASLAHKNKNDICFLIIGDGPLREHIEAAANKIPTLIYRSGISRTDYQSLLTTCDCGVVATMRDTNMPTFPSKTIDYLKANIPIIASTEATTDYATFIEENLVGKKVEAGNHKQLLDTTLEVCNNSELAAKLQSNGNTCMEKYFNVDNTVSQIISAA